jgi:hypothetical protein
MNQIKKTELNELQQKLIELMQQINFGRISNIPVVGGNPELTADTIIEREIKLGGQNGNRPELAKDDFTLKQEVLALIEHLTGMGDGVIRHLEIKHGLPFLIRIEERAA